MAYYNQGSMSPADYWNEQQGNQRNTMQNVLNLMMTMKQMKMQQGEQQKAQQLEASKYADEQKQKAKDYGLAERRVASTEKQAASYEKSLNAPPKPPNDVVMSRYLANLHGVDEKTGYRLWKGTKTLTEMQNEEQAKATGRALGTPVVAKDPTVQEYKLQYWKDAIKKGRVSQEEGITNMDYVMGKPYPDEYKGPKGAAARNSNYNALERGFYVDGQPKYKRKNIQDIIESSGNNPPVDTEGIRVDMPFDYNHALENKKDGIESTDDQRILDIHDAAFYYFQEARKLGIMNFSGGKGGKDFMTWKNKQPFANDKEFPFSQVKKWYEYYK